ncbi:sodium-coupled monocarboxylate transporter 1-like [Amphiura filiformis]|uniref:sodium-coupled monocarboxylate transporter 1-like n=1 Tax=Amphiura filiformis TaxID=82378 RepID=UPI003B220197
MSDSVGTFGSIDYVVFGCMLGVSALIGIYYAFTGGKQKTTKEFLLADRNMNPIPVAMSLVASFLSAITVLGTPAEMYIYGTMYWWTTLAYVLAGVFVARFTMPLFFRFEMTSANEYLELRFNKAARFCALLAFMCQMFVYMAIVIYAPALALNQVTGINLWGSVLATGLVCTFYTTIGGMKAVLWTDTFQTFIMLSGFLAVIIEGCRRLGGMDVMWKLCEEGGRIEFLNIDPDPTIRHTVWTIVIGGTFSRSCTFAVNQAQVQRYLACGTQKRARWALLLGICGMVVVVSLACLSGLTMYAYYKDCDPLSLGIVSKSDQLMPYFTLDLFRDFPGLPGLFTSAVFSGALSTVSSGLNSLAAVTTEDFVKSFWKNLPDTRMVWISKGVALLYGLFAIFLSYIVSLMSGSVLTYLEMRFNKVARLCALVTFMVQMFLYMGIVIYAPALALNQVTGINLWGSVLATGLVCTFYTTIGGMKAVLWTDVFQVVVMLAGFFAVIIEGCRRLGGIDVVWQKCDEGQRLEFWDFDPDPTIRHTFWTIVVGGTYAWGYTYGVNQAQVQRYLSCGTVKRATTALALAMLGMTCVVSLACVAGLTMYAYYKDCDPLALGRVSQSDQLIAYFTLDLFGDYPGLPGLFTSAVFSGALSSVSSGLNALAAVTTEDFVKMFWKNWTEERMAYISKGVALFYGLVAVFLSYVVSLMSGSVLTISLSLFGMLGGPLFGMFSLGMFFPWANSKGAVSGIITGLALTCWVGIGANLWPPTHYTPPLTTDACPFNFTTAATTIAQATQIITTPEPWPAITKLYTISYLYYPVIGWCCCILVGLVVSFITGKKSQEKPSHH